MPDRGDWLSDAKGRRLPHGSWPPTRTAPGELELVRQFVNTRNPHTGADVIGTVAEMRAWLVERHLLSTGVDRQALVELHRLRDVIHGLAIANSERATDDRAWQALTAIGRSYPMRIVFAGDAPTLRSTVPGYGELVVRMLAAIAAARHDGSWSLLKACHDESCRWVIYDRSKNRSAGWCSAGTCGGKARARSYRARVRGGASSPAS